MSDEYVDPSGNTQQFRAFVQRTEAVPEKSGPSSRLLVIGSVTAVVVIVAVVTLLALL